MTGIPEYKNLVAGFGCTICGRPAQLHHPRTGKGLSQRADDVFVIPLCIDCHTRGTTYAWPSIHGAPSHFFAKHRTTEIDLVVATFRKALEHFEIVGPAPPAPTPASDQFFDDMFAALDRVALVCAPPDVAVLRQIRALVQVCRSMQVTS